MTRRSLISLPLMPKLGSPDWDFKYRPFVKALNLFIIEYNDGKLAKKLWDDVERCWAELHE